MSKHGADFEKAVFEFAKTLKPSVEVLFNHKVPDADTKTMRQCDVWINAKLGGHFPLHILVSCKDHTRKLHVGDIGTFRDEIRSTGASTGIIYSKSGFTRQALEKAQASGIVCCRLYQNQPAEMPVLTGIESFIFSPEAKIALVNKLDDLTFKTWGSILSLKESGEYLYDLIEEKFFDAEKKAVENQFENYPKEWELNLKIIPDNPKLEIKIKILGTWKLYKAKNDSILYNGSHSILNNSFRGTITTPQVNLRKEDPGNDWIEITDKRFVFPKNKILTILYESHGEGVLRESLEFQPLS